MDIMEMFRRNMLGNQSGSEGDSNVSSIFDLIFPKGSRNPGIFGVTDLNGVVPSTQEIPGGLLSFWQTRLSKWQAMLQKMFSDIKEKADAQWQELAQKNAAPPNAGMEPLNARSAQMGNAAGGAVGYIDPFSAGASGVSSGAYTSSRGSGSGYSR